MTRTKLSLNLVDSLTCRVVGNLFIVLSKQRDSGRTFTGNNVTTQRY